MTAKTKTLLSPRDAAQLRQAWERLDPEQRAEVYRFTSFLGTAPKHADPEQYVNPLAVGIIAMSKAEGFRHETYSFDLLQKIDEYNRVILEPALKHVMEWAKQIRKETRQLETKARRARKGGKRGKRSS